MNRRQRVVLCVGFILILASGVYPPWIQWWDFVVAGEGMRLSIGPAAGSYSWIHRPPRVPSWVDSEFRKPDDKEITNDTAKSALTTIRMAAYWRARIDMARLAIEWFVILAGVCCGFFTLGRKDAPAGNTEDLRGPVGEVWRHP